MGNAVTQFYKRLANLLSAKHGLSYNVVMDGLDAQTEFFAA